MAAARDRVPMLESATACDLRSQEWLGRKAKAPSVIDLLIDAYNAEIETVMNYIVNSVNLDGVRAEQISFARDHIPAELGHATDAARRIKTTGGCVPGSLALKWSQARHATAGEVDRRRRGDQGRIAAEEAAIEIYTAIIKACEGEDYVTQEQITILADEQEHRREFIGFLKGIPDEPLMVTSAS